MENRSIYLDYMATTPVDPRVAQKMMHYLGMDGVFGNPSSTTHIYGQEAAQAVQFAREQIADTLHADPQTLIFTSGATEAINLALLGAARFYSGKGKHLLTLSTEHKAVLDTFKQLEKEGFSVTYLNPEPNGLLNIDKLKEALTPQTILVSIMQVNNEIGIIQDIQAIGELLADKGILFHVDAAQSAGKLAIDLGTLPVHLMSFSAHKNYGPKGVGALFVRDRPRVRLFPISYGGGQERGLRSGTLPTHQIVGMGEAFALSEQRRAAEQQKILQLRTKLWQGIQGIPGLRLNGDERHRVAGNLNFSIEGISAEALRTSLPGLALSSSSACFAASNQPSYVLQALGLSKETALNSIRLAIGRFTTEDDIEYAITMINEKVSEQSLSR